MTSMNIISDLHLVFSPRFIPTKLKPADILIVAGDLSTAQCYEEHEQYIRDSTEGMFKQYIFIKGNHDYYHCKFEDSPATLAQFERNFVLSYENIDFICATLWTPILRHPHPWCIKYEVNDYEYIANFKPADSNHMFYNDLDWIKLRARRAVRDNRIPVVVTHHIPLQSLLEERRRGDPANAAYCNTDVNAQHEVMFMQVPLWIHGHSHSHLDTVIEGTRYIRNPFGMTIDVPSTINFQYDCVVEL